MHRSLHPLHLPVPLLPDSISFSEVSGNFPPDGSLRIGIPILIRPGAVTIVCVSDPICVTIIIISVCGLFYIDTSAAALEFMLSQLRSQIVVFVIPGTIRISIGICPVSISQIPVSANKIIRISHISVILKNYGIFISSTRCYN